MQPLPNPSGLTGAARGASDVFSQVLALGGVLAVLAGLLLLVAAVASLYVSYSSSKQLKKLHQACSHHSTSTRTLCGL